MVFSIVHSELIGSLLLKWRKDLRSNHLGDDPCDFLMVALRQPIPEMIQRDLMRAPFLPVDCLLSSDMVLLLENRDVARTNVLARAVRRRQS